MIFKKFWKSNKLDFKQELVEQLRDVNSSLDQLSKDLEKYHKSIISMLQYDAREIGLLNCNKRVKER